MRPTDVLLCQTQHKCTISLVLPGSLNSGADDGWVTTKEYVIHRNSSRSDVQTMLDSRMYDTKTDVFLVLASTRTIQDVLMLVRPTIFIGTVAFDSLSQKTRTRMRTLRKDETTIPNPDVVT